MRYPGSGGGDFAKFENVGDKYEGTFVGTRQVESKFAGDKTVVDIQTGAGKVVSVRLNLAALGPQWANANAAQPARVGERIRFEFVGKYDSKNYGKGRGKDVVIDFLDRSDEGSVTTPAAAPSGDAIEAAMKRVTEKLGAEPAAQILRAIEQTERDKAKHADMLLRAAKLS
jgi:hypothetical protein